MKRFRKGERVGMDCEAKVFCTKPVIVTAGNRNGHDTHAHVKLDEELVIPKGTEFRVHVDDLYRLAG